MCCSSRVCSSRLRLLGFVACLSSVLLAVLFYRSPSRQKFPEIDLRPSVRRCEVEKIGGLGLTTDGHEHLAELFEHIRSAKESIYGQVFVWFDEPTGNKLGQELLDAADRGVKVTLMKERVAALHEKSEGNKQSFFHKEFDFWIWVIEKLFNSRFYWYPAISNHSASSYPQIRNELAERMLAHENMVVVHDKLLNDHSKYWVFDEQVVVLGGVSPSGGALGWKDFMITIDDPNLVDDFWKRASGTTQRLPFGETEVNFIFNKKSEEDEYDRMEMRSAVLDFLALAKEQVIITSPYWTETEVVETLLRMSESGIEVIVVLPLNPNHDGHLNMRTMKRFVPSKVKVYAAHPMVHAKSIGIDRRWLWVGSTNWNRLSMNKLLETAVVLDLGENHPIMKKWLLSVSNLIENSNQLLSRADLSYTPMYAFFESIPNWKIWY